MELPKIPRHWSLMQSAAKETSHTNSHMSQHTVMLSFFSPGWGKLVIGAMIPVAACRTRKNWTLRILHPFKRPATGKSIKFLRSHPFNFGMLKIGLRQPSLAHEDGVTWATWRWPSTPYEREDDDWTVARPEPQIFPYQRWSPNYRKFASFWGRKTNPFFLRTKSAKSTRRFTENPLVEKKLTLCIHPWGTHGPVWLLNR